jgi:hypothetical protein
MELSEQEKYALFANVPYLINEGVPIEDIELELKEYGLDYKIDNELTDTISSTIVGKDDVVHSVRGTDIKSFKDLISDANIITSHPTFIRLFNTLVATTGGLPLLIGDPKISDEIKSALYGMYSGYDALTQWDEGPEMTRDEWEDELLRLENRVRQIQAREIRQNRRNTAIGGTALLSSALALTYTKRLITDNIRIKPEKIKLDKVKDKYPNKNISLSGHSLGSVINILGRKNNIKTISFNPAPQETETMIKAHPESKAYTIKNDPVSYFLTSDDTEKRISVKQKVSNPHSLTNFLPNKQLKLRELKEVAEIKPETFLRTKDRERPVFDYCRFYPNNPKCKELTFT